MSRIETFETAPILVLDGQSAAELMTPCVVSIAAKATLETAVFLLADRQLSAVPVIDEHGQPVGVLSRTDIVAHDFRRCQLLHRPAAGHGGDFPLKLTATGRRKVDQDRLDELLVEDIMTRVVYSVTPKTPGKTVIDAMLALGVHRIFVTDDNGRLKGVISSTDILRRLHEPLSIAFEQVELLVTDRQTYLQECAVGDGL